MTREGFLRYRNVWLGIAMIWIFWSHSGIHTPLGIVNLVQSFGYGGVDICLFASGVGCYHSLSSDPDPCRFLKRRFFRLFPTYWVFLVFWFLFRFLTTPMPFPAVVGNILGIQNFTSLGHDFNWYISAIFLLYILAPYLKGAADHAESLPQKLGVLLLLIAVSIPFWTADIYIISVTRIPVFFLGMLVSQIYSKTPRLPWRTLLLVYGAALAGIDILMFLRCYPSLPLWSYGLFWYPFILITPGLCFLISQVAAFLDRYRWGKPLVSALSKIGEYSFEVYLTHVLIFEIIHYIEEPPYPIFTTFRGWLATVVCVAIASIGLRKLTMLLQKKR